jgi:hypothetical protein
MLAATVLLGAEKLGFAQDEMKPLATVSFAGYDKLKANIGMLGQLGGNPKLADSLEQMLKGMTQGKGLAGLDTKRPWGAAFYLRPGDTPNQPKTILYVFIPATDLKQLMETAKANPRLGGGIQLNGDKYTIMGIGPPLVVQQKGDWAVASIMTPAGDDLAKAPADPLKLLGDLPKKYDLAVRFSVKDVPEPIRQQILAMLQMRAAMFPQGGGGGMSPLGGLMGANQGVQRLGEMLNELDEWLFGLNIDPSTNKTYLDIEYTAKADTKLAKDLAGVKPAKSKFTGFDLPEAALTMRKTVPINDADAAQAKTMLTTFHQSFIGAIESQGLSDDQLALAKQAADDVLDVLQKTIDSKKNDGGLALVLEPASVTLVAGGQIAEGAKLEGLLKKLVEADSDATKVIKLNTDKHEGVRFHTLTVPVPEPKLVPLVGETLEIVIGIGDDRLLVAAGRDAAKTLKKVIDQSKAGANKESLPFEMKASVSRIVKFLAAVAEDDGAKMKMAMAAGIVGQAGDKDHVVVTGSPIPQGMRVRVEIEEGLLKALASMAQMAVGVPPPPGGPPANAPRTGPPAP